MKTQTTQPQHTQGEIGPIKFVEAKLCSFTCDIKGEPIANISGEKINFTIIFPSSYTIEKAEANAERIVKCVNNERKIDMYDELINEIKNLIYNTRLASSKEDEHHVKKAQLFLKQAE